MGRTPKKDYCKACRAPPKHYHARGLCSKCYWYVVSKPKREQKKEEESPGNTFSAKEESNTKDETTIELLKQRENTLDSNKKLNTTTTSSSSSPLLLSIPPPQKTLLPLPRVSNVQQLLNPNSIFIFNFQTNPIDETNVQEALKLFIPMNNDQQQLSTTSSMEQQKKEPIIQYDMLKAKIYQKEMEVVILSKLKETQQIEANTTKLKKTLLVNFLEKKRSSFPGLCKRGSKQDLLKRVRDVLNLEQEAADRFRRNSSNVFLLSSRSAATHAT